MFIDLDAEFHVLKLLFEEFLPKKLGEQEIAKVWFYVLNSYVSNTVGHTVYYIAYHIKLIII